jgi:hypothetical protein
MENPNQKTLPETDLTAPENGDIYEETTGDYLGQLEPITAPGHPIILELAIFHNGDFYVYKLDRKYKATEEEKNEKLEN